MRRTEKMAVEGEDQESGIEPRGDRAWMVTSVSTDTTVSTREMGVENEDQGSGRWYHGWLNSTVGTREHETVAKAENQERGRGDHGSRRGIMAERTDQLTLEK
jgi:hypothetical protein